MPMLVAAYHHKSWHLNSDDIYDASKRCPICHFEGERKGHVTIQKDPLIKLLTCPSCKGLSASLMPVNAVLERYYASYWDEPGSSSGESVTFHGVHRLAQWRGIIS